MSVSPHVQAGAHESAGAQESVSTARGPEVNSDLLDSIDIPIIVVGPDCRIARFNRAATDTFGVAHSDIGRRACNTQALADIPEIEQWCLQVMTDGLAARHDMRNGDRMFLVRISPHTGSGREGRGAVLAFTNVTALRASLEQAIYEREYTKIILNTVVDPLVVLGDGLQVQTANRAFYEWFGISRAHAQGTPLSALGDETWRASGLWPSLTRIQTHDCEFQTLEFHGPFPAVGPRTVLLDARRIERDGAALVLLAFRDITALKQAEQARRESEARFRTLFESMDEGYCVIEVIFDEAHRPVDYLYLEVNPAFEKQTGIHDAKGRLMRELAPEHEQHWFDIYGRIALTGETVRFENAAAALHRYYDVCAFRIGPAPRRQVGIVFNDITARKELERQRESHLAQEEALRREAEATANALAATQETLSRRVEDLAAADRHRNEFLAILAHELRNPLAPLGNAVQILRRAAGDASVTAKARDLIERQVLHMSRLVNDLLEAARAHNGQIKLQIEAIDLRVSIEHVVELVRPLFEAKQQALRVTVPPGPIWVNGDATRLEQVLTNLLSNANKFTPERGHIQISLGLTTEKAGDSAILQVIDDGEGLDTELLPRVFELFTQADRSLAHSKGGLGIGLSLVRTLVEAHGGKVIVRSPGRGRGCAVEVSIPAGAAPLDDEQRILTDRAPERIAPGRCVLIVEDNQDIRESSCELLTMAGFQTVGVSAGREALEEARRLDPYAILLDVGLPDLNGYEVARCLRAMPQFSRTVLIAITGYDTPEAHASSAAAGFDHHICKPVDFEHLLMLLDGKDPDS